MEMEIEVVEEGLLVTVMVEGGMNHLLLNRMVEVVVLMKLNGVNYQHTYLLKMMRENINNPKFI